MTRMISTVDRSESPPVGLLAGSGRFPHVFAEAAAAQGLRVVCAGVAGMAEDSLADTCWKYRSIGISKIGRAIRLFAKHGVDEIVMAGKIEKKILFPTGAFLALRPRLADSALAVRLCPARSAGRHVVARRHPGIRTRRTPLPLRPRFLSELLVTHGFLTRRRPTPRSGTTFVSAGKWPRKWGVSMLAKV